MSAGYGVASPDVAPVAPSPNLLDYMAGQCTRLVAQAVTWIGHGWGDAKDWPVHAMAAGYTVDKNPTLGSVVVWGAGVAGAEGAGHVAEVVGFQASGAPIVQEQNWGLGGVGLNRPDYRGLTASEAAAANYIQPPAGTRLPSLVPSSVVTSPDVAHYGAADLTVGGTAAPAPDPNSPAGKAYSDFQKLTGGALAGDLAGGPLAALLAPLGTAASAAALAMWDVFTTGIGAAVGGLGHAAASALGTAATDVGIAAQNNVVPLAVAAAVLVVLFA